MSPPKTFGTPATRNGGTRLLEREGELGRMRGMVDGVAAGRGGAACIVGPPGIGKTSLLAAAREHAEAAGLQVLAARGGELEREYPFGVVRQLFERAIAELPAADQAAVLGGAAATAAPVVGGARVDPGADQTAFAVTHGLYWVCANLAQRGALVLVLDDLHWADDASLRFLGYLQRRVAELPVLVLGAARPPADARGTELLALLTDDPGAVELVPAPLSLAAVTALVGDEAAPEFAAACHAATGGNPFLCATLLEALAAAGVRPVAAEAPRVTELGTRAVSREVVRRMGQLAGPVTVLARAVSVLGAEAELRHAAALAGMAEDAAAAAVDALAAQGLLRGGSRVAFVHPLLRAAVAEQIPAAERALLHARAARLLADDGTAPEQLAPHLLAAPARGDPWVVSALRAAARTVSGRGDPAAAVRCLTRALDEPAAAEIRPELLHELGVAELQGGAPAAAERHLREAADSREAAPALRCAAGRDLSLALRMLRRYEESVAEMDGVIARVADEDPDRALGLLGELHQTAMMDPATYAAVSPRFDDLDRGSSGRSRGERGFLAAAATESCLRTAGAALIRARAEAAFAGGIVEDDDPQSGLWANVAFPLIFAEGFDLAARMCAAALERARNQGSPLAVARAHLVSCMLGARLGAIREAEADARTALEVGGDAALHSWPIAAGVLLEVLTARGELDAADDVLRETGLERDIPEAFVATWALLGRATLRLAQGRMQDGVADLEDVGRRGHAGWRPWNPAMFPYRSKLAAALMQGGDPQRARALAEEEVEMARRWGAPRALGVALRARGAATGDLEDLRAAVRTLAGSGARVEHAQALVDLGSAIARTGRRTEAREPLREGLELAHRQGASALATLARTELVAAGARPRRIMRTGVDALTPSELRVARMAAGGMTNREIAQALFVSLRTVEVHLTHTYQKLGVTSRGELPRALPG